MDFPQNFNEIDPPQWPETPDGYSPVCGAGDIAGYYRLSHYFSWTEYSYLSPSGYSFRHVSWSIEFLVQNDTDGTLAILQSTFGESICSVPDRCGELGENLGVITILRQPRSNEVTSRSRYVPPDTKLDVEYLTCYDHIEAPNPFDRRWCNGLREQITVSFDPEKLPQCATGGGGGDPDCCDCCTIAEKLLPKLQTHPLYRSI